MYDSILYYSSLTEQKSTILKDLGLINPQSAIPRPGRGGRIPQYYLATLHRAENTDDPKRLKSILKAFHELGKEAPVVLPLHPRTKKVMKTYHLPTDHDRVRFIEPVSYLNMLALEKHASAILTDSGGVQKEAYWLNVPCLTLRDETEWVETVQSGWNVLVGADTERIIEEVRKKMGKRKLLKNTKIFGDGKGSEKIVEILWTHIGP